VSKCFIFTFNDSFLYSPLTSWSLNYFKSGSQQCTLD